MGRRALPCSPSLRISCSGEASRHAGRVLRQPCAEASTWGRLPWRGVRQAFGHIPDVWGPSSHLSPEAPENQRNKPSLLGPVWMSDLQKSWNSKSSLFCKPLHLEVIYCAATDNTVGPRRQESEFSQLWQLRKSHPAPFYSICSSQLYNRFLNSMITDLFYLFKMFTLMEYAVCTILFLVPFSQSSVSEIRSSHDLYQWCIPSNWQGVCHCTNTPQFIHPSPCFLN